MIRLQRWKLVALAATCAVLILGAVAPLAAQQGRISGSVNDPSGQPIVGAQVVIDGTTFGTVTNEAGRYLLLNVPPGTYTVIAQFLGYADGRRENVRVSGTEPTVLDFQLRTTILSLEEVVVTGVTDPVSGVKLPFSIGKVKQEDITAVPTTNSALAAIQGKVAGVSIMRTSGQPGAGVDIMLRTPTSIQRSNTPMFVVDGVILSETVGGTTVDIESMDIESIEVVKGAAAASLYGSRAAAGVIQIRTRRGSELQEGTTRLDIRTEYGTNQAPQEYPLSTHHHFVTNEQGQWLDSNGDVTTDLDQRVVDGVGFIDNEYGVPLYNNVARFFKPKRFMTNTVSLAQNTRSTNFRIALNNYDERGSLENNDGFWRRSFRLNVDHRIGDEVNLSSTVFHSRSRQDDLSGSPFWDLLMYPPEVDLGKKGPDGQYLQQPDPNIHSENPIWRQASRENYDQRSRTQANLTARYSPMNWLNFQAIASYDRADNQEQIYVPKGTPLSLTSEDPSDGRYYRFERTANVVNASLSANLMRSFGDLTARMQLLANMEREERLDVEADGRDLSVIGVPSVSVARTVLGDSEIWDIRSNGYYVQTGIDYAGKYIGDILVRRDGSSLFGPESRWQTYYRGAAAYRVSEEPWWPLERLGEFKLRYAIGTAGGRPEFSDRFETWGISGTTGAVTKGTLGNRDLRPEKKTEQEIGVDLIAMDRYSLQLSYVTQTTEDQLIQLVVPAITGYESRWANAGTQKGTTYEATLEAVFVNRTDLNWTSTFVADRSRTEITEFNRACFISGIRNFCAGSSLSDIWGEVLLTSPSQLPEIHAGSHDAFQVNDDGWLVPVGAGNTYRDGVAKDLWGTTLTIDGVDYAWGIPVKLTDEIGQPQIEKIGSSLPDLQFGWLNNVRWKNFSLHTHVHAQFGGEVYNNTKQRLYQHTRHADLDQAGKLDEVKKPEVYYFRIYNSNNSTNAFVEDGTYMKLRELSLRYNFTQDQLARFGLGWLGTERFSLGIIGRNLYTLTDYTGYDPEVGSVLNRIDSFEWPLPRTFTGVVEISF